jgi:uncharacterized protein YkwD
MEVPVSGLRRTHRLLLIALLLAAPLFALAQPAIARPHLSPTEQAVLREVNAARGRAGLAPVAAQRALLAAARSHSRYMARYGYLSHVSAGGEPFGDRLVRFGYGRAGWAGWAAGEDIATGRVGAASGSAAGVVARWLRSPAHRAVLLHASFRDAGIGVQARGKTCYVTLDLGRRTH